MLDLNKSFDEQTIISSFAEVGYVMDEELATVMYLLLKLQKPLLIEGNPGIGKTSTATHLADCLDTKLIRLQCFEGLDLQNAVYEWNYQKQLLGIKIREKSDATEQIKEAEIFGADYLLKRPLLESITAEDKAPVLLIDEIDRADEEFEAFLLELLSDFQISIPEMGTIKAKHTPLVILTSNRTRELSDALRRRCLYQWIDYPSPEKELRIIQKHYPEVEIALVKQLIGIIQNLRIKKLNKVPGISETLDWVSGLMALGYDSLDVSVLEKTLGCFIKSQRDIEALKEEGLHHLIASK
ncbi:MAG: MoxR family ATPase [Saprospiraceae bacterium]|nr:MoxR family ATPase [Saprospiraceae bacterium]